MGRSRGLPRPSLRVPRERRPAPRHARTPPYLERSPSRADPVSRTPISASLGAVRRLIVTKQHLSGPGPSRANPEEIVAMVPTLPYVQWDPVGVVAPSHLLSIWARLGPFPSSVLDRLMWEEKRLLLLWTPIANLVATDDYPLYASLMQRFPDSLSGSWGSQRERARKFLTGHGRLRKRILKELESGPRRVSEFSDHARTRRNDGEWTPRSDVAQLLEYLHMKGEVMVVGHARNQNLWGRTDQFLPPWVERRPLSASETDRAAVQKAIRGLGVATPREINYYYLRGQYRDLRGAVRDLEDASRIHQVVVRGVVEKETRYLHDDDVSLLERLESETLEPRVALLPPFDNMVQMQGRAQTLFGFDYVREQFLPPEKRRFGMWVLPILSGERFVGRMDLQFDKEGRELRVKAIFAERGTPPDRDAAVGLKDQLESLAGLLGAQAVKLPSRVPGPWKEALHGTAVPRGSGH